MSQQTPYESAINDQPGYGYEAPGYAPAPQKTNTMAILGLVFAFVFSPLGIVFSAIGLSQIKKRREGGRGLALAGLILSIVFFLISLAVLVFAFAAVNEAVTTAQAEATASAEGSGEDPGGVLAACEVIAPAMTGFEADMASVTTPEEYALVITDVRTKIEGAAATSSDAVFVGDVQMLSDDLQLAADTVMAGEDPTYLEGALTEDGARVDTACATAGYTD